MNNNNNKKIDKEKDMELHTSRSPTHWLSLDNAVASWKITRASGQANIFGIG